MINGQRLRTHLGPAYDYSPILTQRTLKQKARLIAQRIISIIEDLFKIQYISIYTTNLTTRE